MCVEEKLSTALSTGAATLLLWPTAHGAASQVYATQLVEIERP